MDLLVEEEEEEVVITIIIVITRSIVVRIAVLMAEAKVVVAVPGIAKAEAKAVAKAAVRSIARHQNATATTWTTRFRPHPVTSAAATAEA